VPVFGDLPPAARLSAGRALAEARPLAAWALLGSVLLDPEAAIAQEERSVRALLALADGGAVPDPVPALRRLLARGDLPEAARAEALAVLARRPVGPR
jgi:hypothetical protein